MSLVGPRPLLRRELDDYGAVISLYERVRPGITGLWQISGRSHTTFAERVSYDEWYIKNWTVWYDMVIVLQTFWVLMRGGGIHQKLYRIFGALPIWPGPDRLRTLFR